MENYSNNSDKARKENAEKAERHLEPVINGAKTRKRGEGRRFVDLFVPEDISNAKMYITDRIVVPLIKKALSDIVQTLLYGEGARSDDRGGKRTPYRNYYEREEDRVIRAGSAYRGFDYNDIVFDDRGDAEIVLDSMIDTINRYGVVSVMDFYELSHVSNDNFALQRYGWYDLRGVRPVRRRDGWMLQLPTAKPLN